MFANQLQMQTEAVFVGEPTGQGPVVYGGPYLVELPQSRLVFAISLHLTVSGFPFDKRNTITPDVHVEYSSDDFMTGRDPVLEAAQSIDIPARGIKPQPSQLFQRYVGRYLLNPVQVMDVKLKDTSLYASFTDFIPGSLLRFQSELFTESEGSFRTRITGMNIQFSNTGPSGTDKLILTWQGETVTFNRAPDEYTLATELFHHDEFEAGCVAIRRDKDLYREHVPALEIMLNKMGYDLMRRDDLKSALQVFQLNTELYPESYNVYDSYGEALRNNGDREEAIINYRKSLILNPDSRSGKRALREMGVEM